MNPNSVDIEIRRSIFFPKKRLIINETFVSYGDKSLLCSEIQAIRFGSIQLYVNGIKASKTYEFGFLDKHNQILRITFVSSKIFGKDKKKDAIYENIINACWHAVSKRIFTEWLGRIESGKSIRTSKAEVFPDGIKMKGRKFFTAKEVFVPWNNILKQSARGHLILYPKDNKRLQCRMKYIKDWNCIILHYLLNYLWEDGRAYKLSRNSTGTTSYQHQS